MARHTKGITVQTLRSMENDDILQSIVNDQIAAIDSNIILAHKNGQSSVEYVLPVNFSIGTLNKADAQILVYSELITAYKKPMVSGGKGFVNTTINIGVVTTLYITWLNGLSDEEKDRRRNLLRAAQRPK
jgi:hypothetical protein